jgi:hypothetical protein
MARAAVSIESRMGGYTGAAIQPYYPFIPEERRREVMEGLVRRYMEDADFSEGLVVENGERNISPLEYPFIIKAKGHASSFIEKAGPKYLFKIGEVIGPQTEMYQEHERQNPIENDYNRSYNRVIRFNVPEGYEVKNLADLNMEVFHEEDGDRIYTFESSYQLLADGRVEVRVVEYYKRISCDIQYFEPFRAVVNAAADFNKIVLVMERKP